MFENSKFSQGCAGNPKYQDALHLEHSQLSKLWTECQDRCMKQAKLKHTSGCCEARDNGAGYCLFHPGKGIISGQPVDAKAVFCSGT